MEASIYQTCKLPSDSSSTYVLSSPVPKQDLLKNHHQDTKAPNLRVLQCQVNCQSHSLLVDIAVGSSVSGGALTVVVVGGIVPIGVVIATIRIAVMVSVSRRLPRSFLVSFVVVAVGER